MSFDIDVTVTGLDRVRENLGRGVIFLEEQLTLEELVIIGERTLQLAQYVVPFRTGALRASLQIEIDPAQKRVAIGTDIGYGKFVELGTSKMMARPFLLPSLLQAINEFKARVPGRFRERSRIGF